MGYYLTQQDPLSTFFNLVASPLGWLIILAVIILIFFIIREILCWYWKINESLDSLNDIKREIATTNALLQKIDLGATKTPATEVENNEPPQNKT